MLVHVFGAKCIGINAIKVTVEMDISFGIGIHLVGLADVAVKESLLRTTTALQALDFHVPGKKIIINLAPADLQKNGSGYDLPIAVGILAASHQRVFPDLERYLIMGELGLDGSVRSVPGGLPFAEFAADQGFKACILPLDSALEAAQLEGMLVYGVRTLGDVVRILEERDDCRDLVADPFAVPSDPASRPDDSIDFADIIGQEGAKRGAEIAACGGHNLILVGSPGSGKSSLAKAISGILPPLSQQEALETSKIYSIAGKGNLRLGLIHERPFRSPHYSASLPAMIGGGGGDEIRPGEISLASGGVLFLDEFGQMPRSVIEALRGPLEDGKVTISRLRSKVEFPASFMMVAASNPCPCGYYGEGNRCTCSEGRRQNYLSRLSGPVMDRIDLQVWMHPVESSRLFSAESLCRAESSAQIRERVVAARGIQLRRFSQESINCNARMGNKQIAKYCPLDSSCQTTMENLMKRTGLSMRAYFRIIKVARTIADLEAAKAILCGQQVEDIPIRREHLIEAAAYRFLDRGEV